MFNCTKISWEYTKTEEEFYIHKCIYICKPWGKVSGAYDDLNELERRQTTVKPYAYDVCVKSFYEIGQLSIHKRVHTREKPEISVRKDLLNAVIAEKVHSKEKYMWCLCEISQYGKQRDINKYHSLSERNLVYSRYLERKHKTALIEKNVKLYKSSIGIYNAIKKSRE